MEARPGKVAADTSALIVSTNLPSYQMPMDHYYVGLEQALTGFRKAHFRSNTMLLSDRYPDIANLFDAFNSHDIVPESF